MGDQAQVAQTKVVICSIKVRNLLADNLDSQLRSDPITKNITPSITLKM